MAISQHPLKSYCSIISLNNREFLSFNFNYVFRYFPSNGYSKITHLRRRDSNRASFFEEESRNSELTNSIEGKDITPEGGLEQVGRNDPSDIVSEEPPK